MDWTDIAIAVPVVILVIYVAFHAGGWYHKLEHVLEHGHEVEAPPPVRVPDAPHFVSGLMPPPPPAAPPEPPAPSFRDGPK